MVENKVKNTLRYIDNRIENYSLPLFTRIVRESTNDPTTIYKASSSLRTALRAANLFDFFYETGEEEFQVEAWKQLGVLFHDIGEEDRVDLEEIGNEIITFFEYEKELWEKVQGGKNVTDEELREFLYRKSSDALFYGRVIKIFIPDEDFSNLLHINMQLLDIMSDIKEWDIDIKNDNPNILFMLLSRNDGINVTQQHSRKEAVARAKELEVDKTLVKLASDIRSLVPDFNLGAYEFIKGIINSTHDMVINQLVLSETQQTDPLSDRSS